MLAVHNPRRSRVLDHDGSWTYLLVTPDGVVTQSVPWLLEQVRAVGLQPVTGKVVRVRSADMLAIYATSAHAPGWPPQRAFDLWYGVGPGCVLVLRSASPGASATMLELKGATDPRAARAGSLRHAGENGLMNLVHCPDDDAAAPRELVRLVGKRDAAALQLQAASPREQVRRLTVDHLAEALPVCRGVDALSVPFVVNALRTRIAHGLAPRAPNDRVLSDVAELAAALREERAQLHRAPTSPGRAEIARARNEGLHGRLIEVAQETRSWAVAGALSGLSMSVLGTQDSWPSTRAALRSSGAYVSEMESAALEIDALVHGRA